MNPIKIGTGKSFKGLAAYLLHDPDRAQTAARVGWTQSFNLDEADPEKAWRLMAATAMSADALKEAAGIKKGKPAKNVAYHFSITFDPTERTDERTERAAVAGALKALGMQDHQALAVRHTDTDHGHIHVMVNLIDPATGLSAASKQPDGRPALLSNDQKKLSTWAARFEREHGLKITQGRLENANKRSQGERVDARRKKRNVHERDQAEGTDRRLLWMKVQENDRAKKLTAQGRELAEQHRQEWQAAREAYKIEKGSLQDDRDTLVAAEIAAVKEERKKSWSAMFMRQRSEVQDFERGEKTAIGRIWHSAAVVKEKAITGDLLGAFVAAFSKDARRGVVDRKHQQERAVLASQVKNEIAKRIRAAKRESDWAAELAREGYRRVCADLKASQGSARQDMKEQWRDYNTARRQRFDSARNTQRDRSRGQIQDRGFTLDR